MVKKICFVSTTSITMKCFIVPIAIELTKTGVDVTLICNNDESLIPLCEINGVKYHPIQMGRGFDVSCLKAIRELSCFFKAERFNLVQYCTPNAAFYTSIAAKNAKIMTRLYCQWGIRYVGFSGVKRVIFKLIEKTICRLSTDIRAVSFKNRDFAVSEGLYKREKARVIGNGGTIGVDMTLFNIERKNEYCTEIRRLFGIPRDAFVFGFCGRLSQDKGSNELLAAFRVISAQYAGVRLFIVGAEELNAEIDNSLLQWAKESKTVVFAGKIPENKVSPYYAAMNVLVHPTYREGFGMVIQEAGAYAIPCITTNIPGASEVMEDGKSCIIIEARNKTSLQEAMINLFINKAIVDYLGENAFVRTKELYNRKVMLENQKRDFLELLEGRH